MALNDGWQNIDANLEKLAQKIVAEMEAEAIALSGVGAITNRDAIEWERSGAVERGGRVLMQWTLKAIYGGSNNGNR